MCVLTDVAAAAGRTASIPCSSVLFFLSTSADNFCNCSLSLKAIARVLLLRVGNSACRTFSLLPAPKVVTMTLILGSTKYTSSSTPVDVLWTYRLSFLTSTCMCISYVCGTSKLLYRCTRCHRLNRYRCSCSSIKKIGALTGSK